MVYPEFDALPVSTKRGVVLKNSAFAGEPFLLECPTDLHSGWASQTSLFNDGYQRVIARNGKVMDDYVKYSLNQQQNLILQHPSPNDTGYYSCFEGNNRQALFVIHLIVMGKCIPVSFRFNLCKYSAHLFP